MPRFPGSKNKMRKTQVTAETALLDPMNSSRRKKQKDDGGLVEEQFGRANAGRDAKTLCMYIKGRLWACEYKTSPMDFGALIRKFLINNHGDARRDVHTTVIICIR
jgi:hypothetical protein